MKCKCPQIIPAGRVGLGYTPCINCRTPDLYSYLPIFEHKTGNTIQIVSQSLSAAVHKAWRRK